VLRAFYERVHPAIMTSEHSTTPFTVDIEYSIHGCPARLYQELKLIFPELFPTSSSCSSLTKSFSAGLRSSTDSSIAVQRSDLLIIPTFQPCRYDLVGAGPEQDREKDEKLEHFYLWAITLCSLIREQGHWADFTDPASGYPVLGPNGPSFYPDVPGAQTLLNYDVTNTGCCSLLVHPRWQTKVYPATVFTAAPVDVVLHILSDEMHSDEMML
jgi:hypothetical protein